MKKTLFILGLLLSSFVAQAGPLEEVIGAMQKAQGQSADKEQIQALTETVVRGYVSSSTGMLTVPAATSHIGFLASKAVAQQAIANAGFVYVASQNRMDFYKQATPAPTAAVVLMAYYDVNGFASEVYVVGDGL